MQVYLNMKSIHMQYGQITRTIAPVLSVVLERCILAPCRSDSAHSTVVADRLAAWPLLPVEVSFTACAELDRTGYVMHSNPKQYFFNLFGAWPRPSADLAIPRIGRKLSHPYTWREGLSSSYPTRWQLCRPKQGIFSLPCP